jgi:hypothetical protein
MLSGLWLEITPPQLGEMRHQAASESTEGWVSLLKGKWSSPSALARELLQRWLLDQGRVGLEGLEPPHHVEFHLAAGLTL